MPRQTNARTATPVPSRSVRARVRRFIREHQLWAPGARVLVGVSGGPDSTCLLVALAALRTSLRFELCAAHFDHRLRGTRAAAREQRFVRSLTEALAVPLQCGGADVRAHAKRRRRSLEEAARELRYRFLANAARAAGCDAVAVGHTRNDQAETVLLHLLRGSELLPLLRDYNPRIDDALLRLASAASDDIELLEGLAAEVLAGSATAGLGDPPTTVRIQRGRLRSLPPALQRHAVRLATVRLLGDARGLSDRHVRAVLRANDGPTGARLDLPRGLRAEVTRDTLALATAAPLRVEALPDGEMALPAPGVARFGPWRFQAKLLARPPRDLASASDPYISFLDADACGERLSLRRRRPGDRFQPLGLSRPKKLQDFFVDAHIPRAERDAVPLLCAERGIAWVVGQRPAEWAKVTAATRRVLRLRATREPA